jgi:hypothetical protein
LGGPQPSQEKQAETLQATAPVSSDKWTFGVLAVASLSVALGWNWKEKVYYRARSGMYENLMAALTM